MTKIVDCKHAMKETFIIVLFFMPLLTFGQVTDNFSDGDFTNNPTWSGSTSQFIVNNSGLLQLNNSIAGTSFLSTAFNSASLNDLEWHVYIKQSFSPSSNNYSRVYLTSDQSDLTGSLNGYYLQFGETGSTDAVELFRQSGSSSISVCRATNGAIASSFGVRIKVIRSSDGLWKLFADYKGGYNYSQEASGTDLTYTSAGFMGVKCVYTASNSSNIFYDDFYAGPVIIDSTPPAIESYKINSAIELVLTFSEIIDLQSAETLTNYFVDNSIGNPATAVLQPDQKSIKLTFSTPFSNGVENEITISGIKDLTDNAIVLTTQHYTYVTAVFNDVVINELFPDPSPQIGLPSQEFVEIYNRSTKTLDLAGWKLSDPTTVAILPSFQILPGDYIILTNSSGATSYATSGNVIGLSNFPTLNNDGDKIKLTDATGLKIDSVSYTGLWYQNDDKAEGGWTMERLNPGVNTNDSTNWRASDDLSGGTPGRQNSVFGKNPDAKPPLLLKLTVINDKELLLEFNEALAEDIIQSLYLVNNQIGNPSIVSLSSESKFVQLLFKSQFTNGLDYNLNISGIHDLAGNAMPDLQKSFRYFIAIPSHFKDIIINEIMADPSPVVQLPETEYIELFNRTSAPFDLKDWKLSDATTIVKLGSAIILPNEFIILTSIANVIKFSGYGKVLGVSSFPSLNNGGESLVLKNSLDELIDSVSYSDSWYKDDDHSDGGWSLELIDPQNSCSEEGNWISAEDEKGGTPGKQNSVFASKPDLTGPKLIAVTAEPNHVMLMFDEKLEKDISLSSFSLSPTVELSKAAFTDLSLRQLQLDLTSSLSIRTLYQITIQNLHDCAGNSIQEDFNQMTFALPESADSMNIIINEILFNPKPTGVDFVEIYNHSPKYINLKNFKLANLVEGKVKNEEVITSIDLILAPGAYLAFTEDPVILKNNYPSGAEKNFLHTNLPGLSDDEGSVVLLDDQNHIIDFLKYSEDYHSPLIKDDEGVSLERISFTNTTNDPLNWRSANASTGYATPGYVNSNARSENPLENSGIEIIPEIFSPNAGFNDFASIQYKFDQDGYIANVRIYDQQGRPIKEITNNEAIPVEGAFRWDGDYSDGTKARSGYYLVWFEVFDLSGNVKTYRKRVVLASQK